MESLVVMCPNGHKLTGSVDMVGKNVRCPQCGAKFQLKLPARKSLTETAVMRILGDADKLPARPEPQEKTQRPCPRCKKQISIHANVCEHCKCYAGAMPNFLVQMIADGKSLISSRN
jgi:hypothetical protein